jgi:uncharacterized NAD(P)/FAD-binding protein YdhS
MPGERRTPVAIVGGGFSGTMVAANLARRGINSVVIESSGRAGQGNAYSTTEPAHLLNIRAHNMGAWAEDPEDFAAREKVDRDSFAERRQYGRYLRAILDQAVESGRVQLVEDRAVDAHRASAGWRVRLQGGGEIEAGALVLATGNQAPAKLPWAVEAGDLLIDDPWGDPARATIVDASEKAADVLIVGTSLTMVDTVLSLDAAGHRGRIVAISRRGKIPLPGGPHDPIPVDREQAPLPKVREIARWLRQRSAAMDWRSAIDSLRPHSHRLWQSMPLSEKRLFLRYGRPWWDIHRHRIAPQVHARIEELVSSGRLEVVAGRITSVRRTGDFLDVTYRRRGKETPDTPQRFGYIFNCTGPLADITRTGDPLLGELLDKGEVAPDELAIGLSVDERSRTAGGERLWAVGTLTKGRYWEIIAVPDIRVQAAAVADDIATELGQ